MSTTNLTSQDLRDAWLAIWSLLFHDWMHKPWNTDLLKHSREAYRYSKMEDPPEKWPLGHPLRLD